VNATLLLLLLLLRAPLRACIAHRTPHELLAQKARGEPVSVAWRCRFGGSCTLLATSRRRLGTLHCLPFPPPPPRPNTTTDSSHEPLTSSQRTCCQLREVPLGRLAPASPVHTDIAAVRWRFPALCRWRSRRVRLCTCAWRGRARCPATWTISSSAPSRTSQRAGSKWTTSRCRASSARATSARCSRRFSWGWVRCHFVNVVALDGLLCLYTGGKRLVLQAVSCSSPGLPERPGPGLACRLGAFPGHFRALY
jgi:hypothetical protein